MHRFETINDLTDPEQLCKLIGAIAGINVESFSAIGFSHSVFRKVKLVLETGSIRNLILKQTNLKDDWLSLRSQDIVGREAEMLEEVCLKKIWGILHCPYIAFARENDSTGLLMEDLSAYLFPDTKEPIAISREDIIIDTIASLHALFWDAAEIRKLNWLASPHDYLSMLSPGEHDEDKFCPPPDRIRNNITEGWKLALQLLSPAVKKFLRKPAEEIYGHWNDLPVTLLHGDLKIANMAISPGNKLVLFDWPMIGCAPCAMELGWYLAVNSTRLARTKEEFMSQYRIALESHLKAYIDRETWQRMTKLAVITGAMMLLWNKALGWRSGTEKGKDEWAWWNDHLEKAVSGEW